MFFFHSLPVPELREWVFSIPFPFPNFGNGIIHSRSRSQTPKCHSRSPLYLFAFFISSNTKVLHAASAMTIGISVGVYYQWRLGLVGVVMFPIMVASTVINQKIVNGVSSVEREAFEKSAKVEEFS